MRLNELRDNPGATSPRRRVGRGIGSGKGKTAGRGHKGQKSRSGVSLKGFEGGQMPLHRRLPKRGFNLRRPKSFNAVNIGRIEAAIGRGRLDPSAPVTVDALLKAGVIRRALDGVRLLARGELSHNITFEVTGASAGAVKAVEAAGGTVTLVPMPARPAKPEAEAKMARKNKKTAAAKSAGKAAAKDPKSPAGGTD